MEGDEEPPAAAAMAAVLTDDFLLRFILKCLCPRDVVRAALANKSWRRAAALAVPRTPPLVGYLLHPEKIRSAQIPPVFVPSDASFPRLSLPLAPDDLSGVSVHDVHHGLVLLLPCELPDILLLRILVLDPASGRRALLPPPPRDALPDDQWRQTRRIIGAAVLSRAHPSRLHFQAVCVTIDDDRPRAWVAFVNGEDCLWCILPRSKHVRVLRFDLSMCCAAHDQGQICWIASNSNQVLALEPSSLEFQFITSSPAAVPVDVFAYFLSWPPAFLSLLEENDDALTDSLMSLIKIVFYNICYVRGLFSKEFFSDMPFLPTGMQIKKLTPMDDESQRLVDWLEKGVYDALKKKFLKTIIFSIYDEKGPLLEEYCLSFTYFSEITIDLRLTGSTQSIWTMRSDAAESFVNQIW